VSSTLALYGRTFVIGVAVAAPIGAIGVLCIRRTLSHGWGAGIATGLGVATADGIYAACAAFGLTAVTDALVAWQSPLRLVGGVALVYLGIKALRSDPESCEPAASEGAGLYASAVGLTLTNPATILAFAAIFAGVGLVGAGGTWESAAVATAGVASGSLAWWLALTAILVGLRRRATEGLLRGVNRVSGAVLIAFGIVAGVAAFV
jgi:threonine/homoserine/homoserine lactone efflux protein